MSVEETASVSTTEATPASTTTTGSVDSVPGTLTAEQRAVVEAYTAADAAYRRAALSSDPADASLAAVFAPEFLKDVRLRLQQRAEYGQAVRDPQPSRARTTYLHVVLTPPTATVTACEVDDRVVYQVADGSVVNDQVATTRWSISMVNGDGGWKLAGRQPVATWNGEEMAACVAARS